MKTSILYFAAVLTMNLQLFTFNSFAQWQQTGGPYDTKPIQCIATSNTDIFIGNNDGVFLSTNNGSSWSLMNNGIPDFTSIYSLAIDGNTIFAGTDQGVFLSTNNGSLWTAVNAGLTDTTVLTLAINGSSIFAGTNQGVFLSTNNGSTWTADGLSNTTVMSFAISGTNLFAATNYGLFLSTDNGANWVNVDNGLQNNFVITLAISGSNIFAGTSSGVFLSTNNGTLWTEVNTGLTNTYVNSLAIIGSTIYAGTYGGVFLSSNNGGNWVNVNNDLADDDVVSLAVNGTSIFAGTYRSVFVSTNSGSSWTPLQTITGEFANATSLVINGTDIITGTWGGGIFLSTTNGNSWTSVNKGLKTDIDDSPFFVNSFAISGNTIFAGTEKGLFSSNDNGNNWVNLADTNVSNKRSKSLAISGNNFFAGTDNGVFLSTDNGNSWTSVSGGLTDLLITSLVISGSNIFAATTQSVFLSGNNGNSWTEVNSGLPTTTFVYSLVISGNNIFAGTENGIFLSTDTGSTWNAVNNGLQTLGGPITFAVSGTTIFAGTGFGVYLSNDMGSTWNPATENMGGIVSSLVISGNSIFAGTYNGVWERPLSEMCIGPPSPMNTTSPANLNICSGNSVNLTASGIGTLGWYSAATGGDYIGSGGTYISPPLFTDTPFFVQDSSECPSATRTSITVLVTPSKDIYGHVEYSGGNLTNGNVVIYKYMPLQTRFDTLTVVPLNANGDYHFTNINQGDYLIKVFPNAANYPMVIPTYYGNAFLWNDTAVVVVNHNCTLDYTLATIEMVEETGTGGGIGLLLGQIIEGNGFGRSEGDPIPGVDVKLGRNPGGSIAATTTTDSTGLYTFSGVAYGNYTIYVDIPGLGRDSSYTFTVDSINNQFTNLNYSADSTSIFLNSPTITGINNPTEAEAIKFEVYPNPVKGNTTIEYSLRLLTDAKITIDVYNVFGVKIRSLLSANQRTGEYKYSLNSQNNHLNAGVYFITLSIDGKTKTKRIVVLE